jgi:hypothetical protein
VVTEVGAGANGGVVTGGECDCEVIELARFGRFSGILLAGGGTTPPGARGRIGEMLVEGACVCVCMCVCVCVCVCVCLCMCMCVPGARGRIGETLDEGGDGDPPTPPPITSWTRGVSGAERRAILAALSVFANFAGNLEASICREAWVVLDVSLIRKGGKRKEEEKKNGQRTSRRRSARVLRGRVADKGKEKEKEEKSKTGSERRGRWTCPD